MKKNQDSGSAKLFDKYKHPYTYDPKYQKRVAYFSMEFAIAQPLKTYSGGLGFLAGSHMRSAYELKQNLVGIGILWKYGYYDQVRKGDQSMDVLFQEKLYSFLERTGIKYEIEVNHHPVMVEALYLRPEVFGTVPMFFLTTDVPENDYLARSISNRLYDADLAARIAQQILLGIGGAKLLDILGHDTEVYHLNEAHGLAAAFYLYDKFQDVKEVRKRMIFTTHTPEEAGNEKNDIRLLDKMGYFCGVDLKTVRKVTGTEGDVFNHSLVALRFARMANGVSKIHGEVSRQMWGEHAGVPQIISITNAQNKKYWAEKELYDAMDKGDDAAFTSRKQFMKQLLFDHVADQTGKLFDRKVLTIVWSRRFAGYKRADLLIQDPERFHKLLTNKEFPVQIIWAGKPYPMDFSAISTFNSLVHFTRNYDNCAVLVGYELALSRLLKRGADVWLNNPRIPREASGTSGMTAAMNGAVNLSTFDGWIPEFANHGVNSYIIPPVDLSLPLHQQDMNDLDQLYDILEKEIVPTYYQEPKRWQEIVKNGMRDVLPYFDSDRMAYEYYEKLYNA